MVSSFGPFGLAARLRRSKHRLDGPIEPSDIWVMDVPVDWVARVSELPPASETVLWRCAARYVLPSMRTNDLVLFVSGRIPVGIGRFDYALSLSIADAWGEYGRGLGAATEVEFRTQIAERYARHAVHDPWIVTCQVVTDLCWLGTGAVQSIGPLPRVQLGQQLCSITSELGSSIAARWQDRMRNLQGFEESAPLEPDPALSTKSYWSRPGQQRFHAMVFENCGGSCIVSGETAGPSLEAAHIHPFRLSANHDVTNGMLLRADLHGLFDDGYWTIDHDGHVRFSAEFIEHYPHSGYFFEFGGQKLKTSSKLSSRFSRDALDWHRTNLYRG